MWLCVQYGRERESNSYRIDNIVFHTMELKLRQALVEQVNLACLSDGKEGKMGSYRASEISFDSVMGGKVNAYRPDEYSFN